MKIKPLQYSIYKGVGGKWGAAQFNFQPPHYFCSECKVKSFNGPYDLEHKIGCESTQKPAEVREGCVFFEITSATAPNVYDWDKKIIMALSPNDMAQLLFGLRTGNDVKLMHDPNAKSNRQGVVSKGLSFTSPKGTMEGGLLTATHSENNDTRKHTVPMNGSEVLALATLLTAALSAALGW